MVEALLNSRVIELVISLEFAYKQRFQLKKIERLIYIRNIYIRNVNGIFNKKKPI